MSQYTRLFEFLSDLIDIQIKKYVDLAKLKVGEDAIISAALIHEEVNELLGFAEKLLTAIETNSKSDAMDSTTFDSVFEQVKFYVEQEHLRSYAEWLLIENNSKQTVYARTKEQLSRLSEIKSIDTGLSQPVTEVQRQCQHDSIRVVYSILNLAIELRNDPKKEFDSIPEEKLRTLRSNATKRYIELQDEIDELHQKSKEFLQQLDMEVFNAELSFDSAKLKSKDHDLKLKSLLSHYKEITSPSPSLPSKEKVDKNSVSTKKDVSKDVPVKESSFFSPSNLLFFGAVALAAVIFVPRLLTQFKANKL